MTVILQAANGVDVQINQWSWRPTTFLIATALGLDENRIERLQVNGIGETVSPGEARRLTAFLDTYLADFPRDGRLLLDGSITRESESRELDLVGNAKYSASYDWLIRFREFCGDSGGFKVM